MASRWLNGRNMFAPKTPNGSQDRRPRSRPQTSRTSEIERFPIRLTKRLSPQATHFRRHPAVLARPLRPGEPRRATASASATSDQVALCSRHPSRLACSQVAACSHLRYYGAASGQEVRIGFPTTIQPRRIKMTNPDHTGTPAATEYATVHLVFELSKATWKLGLLLPGSKKLSRYAIPGGDLKALTELLTKARTKVAGCGKPVRIISCYEAGFDAHWLHRWLGASRRTASTSINSCARCLPICETNRGSAAWCTCRRWKMRIASGSIASASISRGSKRHTRTASRGCFMPKVSVMQCRLGEDLSRASISCAPAMVVLCPNALRRRSCANTNGFLW